MRSVWKGHIRFSLVTIPIQVFNAIETKNEIRFNQLHKEDNGRVSYHKVCKKCDKKLSSKEIVKGYQYEDDQYAVLSDEEMKSIKLKSNKAIDIEAFVDMDEVHPSRYEAVYFVGPSSEVAKQTFSLFVQSLQKSKKAGIGRIILRDREDLVLLSPQGTGLMMYKLRYPYEVRDIEEVPDLEKTDVADEQITLAVTLIESLSTSFDKIDFEDRYRDALLELVNEKIEGKEIVVSSDEIEEAPVIDIMDALKASIEETEKMKKGA